MWKTIFGQCSTPLHPKNDLLILILEQLLELLQLVLKLDWLVLVLCLTQPAFEARIPCAEST